MLSADADSYVATSQQLTNPRTTPNQQSSVSAHCYPADADADERTAQCERSDAVATLARTHALPRHWSVRTQHRPADCHVRD